MSENYDHPPYSIWPIVVIAIVVVLIVIVVVIIIWKKKTQARVSHIATVYRGVLSSSVVLPVVLYQMLSRPTCMPECLWI